MIEMGLLGLLSDQDLHGYELKKQLGELLGSWSSLSFGSLYPALSRLEKAGLVHAVDAPLLVETTEPMGGPMTGALSGELAAFRSRRAGRARPKGRRGKKVYGITPTGRDRFHELLADPAPDDERSFAVKVAFCRHLHPDERLALFERRKAAVTGLIAAGRRPRDQRSDPYVRSLRDRDARALAHDLAWIDELILATTAGIDHTPDAPPGGDGLPAPDFADVPDVPRSGVLADASKEGSP